MKDEKSAEKSESALREEAVLQFWKDQNIFQKSLEKDSPEGEFNFFEGPPTANGRPGLHHVEARSFKDVIPRYKTMQGFNVRRKAGWDTHGLPVELQVEKELGLKSKKEIEKFSVAEFNKKCRESVWQYREEWEKLTERMGFWVDMQNPYVTYENSYIEALWGIIKKADDKGLMYKDFRVGPWCTRCGTGLSSHELNQPGAYKEVKDLSAYVKFPIIGFERAYFLAWTTTPWTLPGNVALAVGANIEYVEVKIGEEILVLAKERLVLLPEGHEIIAEHKGSEMVGMKYENPFPFMKDLVSDQEKLGNAFQIYAADFVTTTEGTGIVHIAPMYGADDFELATRENLPKFHLVNEEGRFISGTDFLQGRYVKESDEKGKPTLAVDIINNLTERNLLFKKENHAHSYPHCWRCDTPLLYYARTSWYFNTKSLRDQMVAANEKINWEPDHIKEGRFGEWLDGIKDWAISRDRYWGTPIPVWETADKKEKLIIGSIEELRNYSKTAITKIIFVRHGQAEHNVLLMSSSARDKHPLTTLGQEQAMQAAKKLKNQQVDVVFSSPILRARQTAQIYCDLSGHEMIIDDRIAEITSGNWEEKTQFDPEVKDEREAYKALSIDERYLVKRGKTGESWADVDARVQEFLNEVIEKYAGKTIVCFAHQGTDTVAVKLLKGMSNKDSVLHLFHQVTNGTISPIYVDTKRKVEFDMHKPFIDEIVLEKDGHQLQRTPEVMDVWFDSGSMPIAQDHKLGEKINFDPKPADYIAEGVDQTRGWFYTMHAIANMLHDTPTTAYKNVICMGLLLDEKGIKMSKSKGNIVSPWDMFDKYGADVIRFWFYSVNQPGDSKNFDEKGLDEVKKKVFNLLENVVKFYEMYANDFVEMDPYTSKNVLDQWILALWNKSLKTITEGLENYKPMEPARAIRDFVGELSQWYIRRSRDRFKSDDSSDKQAALATTRYILMSLTKTMAPFTPFIAEEMYQKLKGDIDLESVHLENFPQAKNFDETVLVSMSLARGICSKGLESRNSAGLKVKQPLQSVTISEGYKQSLLSGILEIMKDELNVKEILFSKDLVDEVVLNTEISENLKNEGEMREFVRHIQDMRKQTNLMPSDRAAVFLSDDEPKWFTNLGAELQSSVGAEKIVWGSGENRVEKI